MGLPVIKVTDVSKEYVIGANSADTFRDQITNFARNLIRRPIDAPQKEKIWALKDINLTVEQGEVLGIIGHNGAGKSTLLKVLSRITHPTHGQITMRGRVSSLLEVGTGFHQELTGRENIFMNAAILGMKRVETRAKFDEIVEFAEVSQFIDTPVKRYSSGMYMRLAFAVAAHLDPEILIVDEVLAVGDLAFQKKSLGKMNDVANEGRTVLLVSHNLLAVRSLCSRAVWLEAGQIKTQGNVNDVANNYVGFHSDGTIDSLEFKEELDRRMQLTKVCYQQDDKDQDITLFFEYVVRETVPDVFLAVDVRTESDRSLFYANDASLADTRKRQVGRHQVQLKIPSHMFTSGNYSISFGFWQPGHPSEHFPSERLTFRRELGSHNLSQHGIDWPSMLYLPSEWQYSS